MTAIQLTITGSLQRGNRLTIFITWWTTTIAVWKLSQGSWTFVFNTHQDNGWESDTSFVWCCRFVPFHALSLFWSPERCVNKELLETGYQGCFFRISKKWNKWLGWLLCRVFHWRLEYCRLWSNECDPWVLQIRFYAQIVELYITDMSLQGQKCGTGYWVQTHLLRWYSLYSNFHVVD